MRYGITLILLALVGCIGDNTSTNNPNNHTALEPAKEEFNRTYYSTIISIWESLMDRNYLYNATETDNGYPYSVEAHVIGEDYRILYRIGHRPDIEMLAYKKNNEELYCLRLLGSFLNCTASGDVFFAVLRDHGIPDIRAYVFRNRGILDREKQFVETVVTSKNIQIRKESDRNYVMTYKPIELNIQEMKVLGVSEADLETIDRVIQRLEMGDQFYRVEMLIYPINNSSPSNRTVVTDVKFNISNIESLSIDFDEYHLKRLDEMLNILNNYLLVRSGMLSESEIYRLAVKTRTPEYCIYANDTKTCISYYVTLTDDKRACSIIGENC